MVQAIQHRPDDLAQRQQFKEETKEFLLYAENKMQEEELKDVYITDHQPKQKRYSTINSKDDEDFFRYKKALQEYNATPSLEVFYPNNDKFKRGSILQMLLDPFAGSKRLDNGALFYEAQDADFAESLGNEE